MSRPATTRFAFLALLVGGLLMAAELYRVTVSREAQDLYRVEDAVGDVYIKTRWCYVYAYSEEALVDTDEMVIHFVDSDDDCDIDKILVGR
jgi:hypothetical protein